MRSPVVSLKEVKHPRYRYVVVFPNGGTRRKRYFKDGEKRKAEAFRRRKETELINHGTMADAVSDSDRLLLFEARRTLAPYQKTLKDALAFYLQHLDRTAIQISVEEVIDELINKKAEAGKSPRYISDLRSRLHKLFDGHHSINVGEISPEDIQMAFHRLPEGIGDCTYENYRRVANVLFNYCVKQRYLDRSPVQVEAKTPSFQPSIFSPDECRELLEAASGDAELLSYGALSLFCGLRPCEFGKPISRQTEEGRTSEIVYLDWADIDLAADRVLISEELSKTRKRFVSISPNLKEWLEPYAKTDGPVISERFRERWDAFRKAAGFFNGWKTDVLRHSFGTYHLALNRNVHETAHQMGNSVPIVHSHYDVVMPKQTAEEFWNIYPDRRSRNSTRKI